MEIEASVDSNPNLNYLETLAGVLGAVVGLPILELVVGVPGSLDVDRHGVPDANPKLPFGRWSIAVWTLSLHT